MQPTHIELAGLHLEIVAEAGIATRVAVPAFDVVVDMGACDASVARRRRVLVTHAHVDHLGGIANYVGLRALWRMPPPVLYVPEPIRDDVQQLLDVWRRLQQDKLPAEVCGLAPGQRVRLGRDLDVVPFATDHRVPSLGYKFVRRTRRLHPDRVGLPGHVLGALRRKGEVVEVETERVVLAVAGDTRIDALLRDAGVMTAQRLVLEVTFLDERVDRAGARAMGHTHLDELVEHAARFENEALLLCHISTRYGAAEAERLVRARLPADLMSRCTVLASDLAH